MILKQYLIKTEGSIEIDGIDSIIFTSDNIEECKEELLIIINQIKFNI